MPAAHGGAPHRQAQHASQHARALCQAGARARNVAPATLFCACQARRSCGGLGSGSDFVLTDAHTVQRTTHSARTHSKHTRAHTCAHRSTLAPVAPDAPPPQLQQGCHARRPAGNTPHGGTAGATMHQHTLASQRHPRTQHSTARHAAATAASAVTRPPHSRRGGPLRAAAGTARRAQQRHNTLSEGGHAIECSAPPHASSATQQASVAPPPLPRCRVLLHMHMCECAHHRHGPD